MAHDHEQIEYSTDELKELMNTCVFTGTIIEVDTDNDTADVETAQFGRINDVPVFYHCENSDVVEGGSIAFEEDDSVYILNKKGIINPNAADLKIVGFVDGLKDCEYFIDITINGKVPEFTKTLKIVDDNDEEYIVSSTEEEPEKFGPLSGIVWPAKIYLYYQGGAGIIFSYFKTPGEPGNYFYAKQMTNTRYCTGGNTTLFCQYNGSGSYVPTGDEEFTLSADRVEYLLHGTFESKPTSPLAFTTKLLGRLNTKSSGFNFGGSDCNSCDLIDNAQTWEGDEGSIIYVPYVFDFYPVNCRSYYTLHWCGLCLGCQGDYRPVYESCSIGGMAIITDENGHSPTFDGAVIKAKYLGVTAQCFQLEITGPYDCGDIEDELCYRYNDIELEARIWEWKILPTPESKI